MNSRNHSKSLPNSNLFPPVKSNRQKSPKKHQKISNISVVESPQFIYAHDNFFTKDLEMYHQQKESNELGIRSGLRRIDYFNKYSQPQYKVDISQLRAKYYTQKKPVQNNISQEDQEMMNQLNEIRKLNAQISKMVKNNQNFIEICVEMLALQNLNGDLQGTFGYEIRIMNEKGVAHDSDGQEITFEQSSNVELNKTNKKIFYQNQHNFKINSDEEAWILIIIMNDQEGSVLGWQTNKLFKSAGTINSGIVIKKLMQGDPSSLKFPINLQDHNELKSGTTIQFKVDQIKKD